VSDPFDAFAAFDPFDGLPPDTGDPDVPAEEAPAPSPSAQPSDEPTDRARVTTRRWAVTRRSLGLTEQVGAKPATPDETPPVAAADTPPAAPPAHAASDATQNSDPGLGAIRAIALPELRAAVTRLRGHRHEAEIINELDADSEPCLAMRFRPDAGPFGPALAGPASYARFELRLAGPRDADPFDGIQLFAGYAPAGAETRFILLGRTAVQALTPDWVAQRVVEFIARTLER
jgi:hypothetical protein